MEMDQGVLKPYIVVIFVQLMYAGMHIISKSALEFGLSPFVFVFYRQVVGVIALLPFAFVVMWRGAPKLSFMLLFKIFIHALIGITLSLNIYNVALKYTSATVASASNNSIPVFTFFLAVIMRMEVFKMKSISGVMKMIGITFCVAGVITIAFYTGAPLTSSMKHHPVSNHQPQHSTSTWIKGSFLMIIANISWSLWLTLQGKLLKEFPSKLLFTTLQTIFSMIQSFFVCLVLERNFAKWELHLDMGLLAVAYSGIVITGLTFYLQSWSIEKKGPVFLAMSTPLAFVFTIIGSLFFFSKATTLGSILGGAFMVGGLYFVLWGKSMENTTKIEEPCIEEGRVCNEVKEMASSCPKV
ncbi:putative EamA domain-containing protein [Dioscorea sansibarensis]